MTLPTDDYLRAVTRSADWAKYTQPFWNQTNFPFPLSPSCSRLTRP